MQRGKKEKHVNERLHEAYAGCYLHSRPWRSFAALKAARESQGEAG